ncbi:hypothetical protein KUTeg_015417 [Tegillarca granosa]|uniref:EGF-like domain-containing protein n=1 Tax=Tegillarca granosa TaxID=220873 RepID=A0ABQ9EVK1_TEGGR|nr:hypothetical protein KUTeg_015417 [Tegillarca granosa]
MFEQQNEQMTAVVISIEDIHVRVHMDSVLKTMEELVKLSPINVYLECNGIGWGPNCKNECNCAPGAVSCDSTKGCVCHIGYNGAHCENDIDECADNPCDKQLEYCENIPGSFLCKCHQGYSKISSKYIEECQTGRHNCDQICKNTIGSFQCLCNNGWFYGDPHIESLDGKQYTFNGIGEYVLMKIVNENVTFELQARTERILKENGTYSNATVFTAFAMREENTTVQKIKHVQKDKFSTTLANIVSYQCENDVNGCSGHPCSDGRNCTDLTPAEEANFGRPFNCSACPKGYTENDKNKCSECEIRKWGLDCANYCDCVNGKCDPVFGCQCDAGFSGSNCDQDVNECKITGICNDTYKTCINTYGSYNCKCQDGYHEENKTCKNIDECANNRTNKCSFEDRCSNIERGYTCSCPDGFHLENDERTSYINKL